MIKSKIRVLVIEDSLLYQAFLSQVIASDDCLAVAGMAGTGQQALEQIPVLKPDIVTLDLQLPDVDGFDLLREILLRWNLPVIVVSGDPGACERAIALGARDFIEKIQDAQAGTAAQFRLLLRLKLKMQAEMRPETGAAPRRERAEAGTKPAPAADMARAGGAEADARNHLIAIGASLGGTEVTLQILRLLPDTLPGIVVVQHIPPEFTRAYAMRLDNCCGLSVREAQNGDPVLPGTVLVAKGGEQLTVCRAEKGYRVKTGGTEKYGGFCPAVDVLFQSVARAAGPEAMGVILTGMGRDGAEGLAKMHEAGAYTLGQNRDTCAVFGMPQAAWKLGAVDELLSPKDIAKELIRYGSRYKKREADNV